MWRADLGGASTAATGVELRHHALITIETRGVTEWVDLTPAILRLIRTCGLATGQVTVQTRHTTTGLLVNEHEPLLLEDLTALFERVAPAAVPYAHDDRTRRTVNLTAHERVNGHAHCRAALLRASEIVHVSAGAPMLGRWQRVLFAEFDGPQTRQVSLLLSGVAEGSGGSPGRGRSCDAAIHADLIGSSG